jgi:two-component system response regulator AtoC
LLRVLQERKIQRLGGIETIDVDVRLLAATNRPLESMIKAGDFRADLFYRLNVIRIQLPALRDRREDLAMLCEALIRRHAQRKGKTIELPPEMMQRLRAYSWPGNVRELENIIERAMILANGASIDAEHLDFGRRGQTTGPFPALTADTPTGPTPTPATPSVIPAALLGTAVDESKPLSERLLDREKAEIIAAVERCNSNIAGAARVLGINRSTLYYRMRKHGLEHLLPTKVSLGSRAKSSADESGATPGATTDADG